MRRSITMGGLALASAAFLLSACGAPSYRYSYYDPPDYNTTALASDPCLGPNVPAYCSYPRFDGTVVIAGDAYTGLRYRMGPYGREFWLGGQWVRA